MSMTNDEIGILARRMCKDRIEELLRMPEDSYLAHVREARVDPDALSLRDKAKLDVAILDILKTLRD